MFAAEKFNRKLLRLVKDNPVLYDPNHASNVDCNAREVVWQKIGDELKRPASECKGRWVNIRDSYRRILRQAAKNNVPRKKQYKYETEVTFLKPFLKDIPRSSSYNSDQGSDPLDNNFDDQDSDDDAIQPKLEKKSKRTKKRESVMEVQQEIQFTNSGLIEASIPNPELDPSDPIDAFLLSIGTTLKTFSPYYVNIAKSKIFSIVQEYDLQQIVQKERPSTSHDIKVSCSENNLHFMQ